MSTHPSPDELRRWLRGEDVGGMDHIDACDTCLDALEELSLLDPVILRTFHNLARPGPGFVGRVLTAIERRRQDGETWSVVGDLFSLGWRTIDTVWGHDG